MASETAGLKWRVRPPRVNRETVHRNSGDLRSTGEWALVRRKVVSRSMVRASATSKNRRSERSQSPKRPASGRSRQTEFSLQVACSARTGWRLPNCLSHEDSAHKSTVGSHHSLTAKKTGCSVKVYQLKRHWITVISVGNPGNGHLVDDANALRPGPMARRNSLAN